MLKAGSQTAGLSYFVNAFPLFENAPLYGRLVLPQNNCMQKFIAIILILCLPVVTRAHSYWIETTGSHKPGEPVTVKLYFGEYAGREIMTGKALDKMKDIAMYVQLGTVKTPITMTQADSCWTGTFTPATEGSYEITGINEVREVQDWTKHNLGIVRPVQYLKHIYQAGTRQTPRPANAFLDLQFQKEGDGHYNITIFKNGLLQPATRVVITRPDGEDTILETDASGKLNYKAPEAGLYMVIVEWIDKTPGRFKEKDYATTRHRLDFSFYNQ